MPYHPEIVTLADMVRIHARERGDQVAMVFNGRETTYGALDQGAAQVAHAFLRDGLDRTTRVAYLGKNSDIYYRLLFGAVRAGGVFLCVNWRLAVPEISYILNDSGAEYLFVEKEFLPVAKQAQAEAPGLRQIIVMEAEFEPWHADQPTHDPGVAVGPDDIVMQMYTSGTTGHPKGVLMPHGRFLALRAREGEDGPWAQWDEGEVNLVAMPFFHIGGTGWGFTGFYHGATNIILPQPDVATIIAAIRQHAITKVFIVPALVSAIVEEARVRPLDLRTVKTLYYGASPIPEETLKAAIEVFGCDFVQLYGMTETLGAVTHLPPAEHTAGGRLLSCGRAMPGVDLRIVDGEGTPLPPGKVGEILIRTPSIMAGYWQREEATAEVLRDGWYHSGDAGYLDEDGYLFLCDRIKDMIVSGAENIYPAEVESALAAHPAVAEVAVIGVPDQKWGEAVKAVVVLRPGKQVTAEELIAFARQRIAGYKVPKSVDFVDALPRNASGKILKRELRRPYWEGQSRQIG
ncbi:MAG: long-chain-fatty-acid--CoA ligase [Alphaproteobacteria bacterium]|nr:MAG: long-chain-fatty-acid--CoA ligase [Alphaproteobacteria bacterium]